MTPLDIAHATPLWLVAITVAVGAVEGALIGRVSREPRYDFMGAFIFAVCLGIGGGVARDLLLGNLPVVAIRTPWPLVIVVVATLLVAVAPARWLPGVHTSAFLILDAVALGLWTAVGTAFALDAQVSVVGALFVGSVAGLAGGVLVALLRGQTPQMLMPGVLYAVVALLGAGSYALLHDVSPEFAALGCVAVVVIIRALAVRFAIRTPPLALLEDPDRYVR
jgi:uncharacterized membrane protein YeiH